MKKQVYCSSEYHVDEFGIVYSKRGNPLKPSVNPNGYEIVQLMVEGKQIGKAVHTLVARAFVPGFKDGLQVNHKDGDKRNNKADNLEWVTAKENTRHSIEVLGHSKFGRLNPMAKAVYGYNKYTGKLEFSFPSVIDAARYFAGEDEKKARHIQNVISQNALGTGAKKSYRKCIWKYSKL